MVVTVAVLQLHEIVTVDVVADALDRTEIHRRTLDRHDLARRHESTVDRRETIGGNPQPIVANRGRRVARKIEIRVIRQIDNGRRIGRSLVRDVKALSSVNR